MFSRSCWRASFCSATRRRASTPSLDTTPTSCCRAGCRICTRIGDMYCSRPVNFLMTIVGMTLVDRKGRKFLLHPGNLRHHRLPAVCRHPLSAHGKEPVRRSRRDPVPGRTGSKLLAALRPRRSPSACFLPMLSQGARRSGYRADGDLFLWRIRRGHQADAFRGSGEAPVTINRQSSRALDQSRGLLP